MSVRLAALVAVLAVSGCTWETRPDGDSPRHLDAARPHPTVSPDPVADVIIPESALPEAVRAGATSSGDAGAAAGAAGISPAGGAAVDAAHTSAASDTPAP